MGERNIWTMLLSLLGAHASSTPASLSNLNNFRDLGGIPCGAASCMRAGVIFRAATPAAATEADVQALESRYGHLRVIDLRKPDDALRDTGPRLLAKQTVHVELLSKKKCRNRLIRDGLLKSADITLPLLPFRVLRSIPVPPVRTFASNVLDRGTRAFLDRVTLADIYWWILEDHSRELRRALDLCAEAAAASTPVMVHCAHGKDRTGVLIAVLLHICGASEEQIAADYALSNEWGCSIEGQETMLEAMPERYRDRFREWGISSEGDWSDHSWPQFGLWCGADETTIHEVWRRVEKRYGSMDGYLDSIGVGAAMRAQIGAVFSLPVSEYEV